MRAEGDRRWKEAENRRAFYENLIRAVEESDMPLPNRHDAVTALSRLDNETPICPDCGIRQSLESIGVQPDERERILEIIHKAAG